MTLQDFVKLLRTRWITVAVTTLVVLAGAVAVTLLTTPRYEASTRLFVSTATGGSSAADLYQGNRLSQDRVRSYSQLLMGQTLAQRTIDKLDLDMSAAELSEHVKASSKPDTVLIDVKVLDPSPVRARDIANALSDEFVVMVRELETPENRHAPDARVVVEQRASLPDHPAVPKKARNIAIGLALGVVLGVGLAVLRDLFDNTVKDQETLGEITGTGVVGALPFDKERPQHPAISFDKDNSAIAEAFRKARTNLQFLSVDNPPRVIVVTSALPNEGKSTTAINIALALAEAEHNVLLVDGDMRRPSLHKYLGLVGQVGFSTVLSGAASLDEAVQKTHYPRLSVLAAGATPPNPSELVGSQTAKKLIEEMRERFDYVIIDSSPQLAVTDAAILATSSDGVLVVARFGKTRRDQLAHAVDSLKDVGAPILGAMFNMIPAGRRSPYSYHYYNYQGYYREGGAHRSSGTPAPPADVAAPNPPLPRADISDRIASSRTNEATENN